MRFSLTTCVTRAGEVMTDAVLCADGHTYERVHIER